MVTIDNYIQYSDFVVPRLPLHIKDNHDHMIELIGLVNETPELLNNERIIEEINQYLIIVNSIINSEFIPKKINLEVTKQNGKKYRIEEIDEPVKELDVPINLHNEPIKKELDVPIAEPILSVPRGTDKPYFSILEGLIIDQRNKNSIGLTNAKIREITGCTRFAFNNALLKLQSIDAIPSIWVTGNKSGRPVK